MRDLLEALVGDAAAARDVAQEGDDVVLPLRPAEAGEDDRVVGDGLLDVARHGVLLRRVGGGAGELLAGVFAVDQVDDDGLAVLAERVVRDRHRMTSSISSTPMRRPV